MTLVSACLAELRTWGPPCLWVLCACLLASSSGWWWGGGLQAPSLTSGTTSIQRKQRSRDQRSSRSPESQENCPQAPPPLCALFPRFRWGPRPMARLAAREGVALPPCQPAQPECRAGGWVPAPTCWGECVCVYGHFAQSGFCWKGGRGRWAWVESPHLTPVRVALGLLPPTSRHLDQVGRSPGVERLFHSCSLTDLGPSVVFVC